MNLTLDQVKHVAKLANLPLTPEEEEKYSEQLSKVLDYIEQLNSVDITNVEPTFNVTGQVNVMREDTTAGCFTQEEALSNAPKKKDGMFETKGVFEDE
ncbi:Asp-tRNA(Asn)/Glu-tRNA(Gln) amidotransferase subunit GatC [Candidatus Daviesbacteria bacterium]|nr:Asp-tRNA(Asn)/Glu-tRNA(Gln) amidotransferase subunit GatC [Candidatus Daviesbacteria bacterium]